MSNDIKSIVVRMTVETEKFMYAKKMNIFTHPNRQPKICKNNTVPKLLKTSSNYRWRRLQ